MTREIKRLHARLEKHNIAPESPKCNTRSDAVLVDASTETASFDWDKTLAVSSTKNSSSSPRKTGCFYPSPIQIPLSSRGQEIRKLEKEGEEFYVHRFDSSGRRRVEPLSRYLQYGGNQDNGM